MKKTPLRIFESLILAVVILNLCVPRTIAEEETKVDSEASLQLDLLLKEVPAAKKSWVHGESDQIQRILPSLGLLCRKTGSWVPLDELVDYVTTAWMSNREREKKQFKDPWFSYTTCVTAGPIPNLLLMPRILADDLYRNSEYLIADEIYKGMIRSTPYGDARSTRQAFEHSVNGHINVLRATHKPREAQEWEAVLKELSDSDLHKN